MRRARMPLTTFLFLHICSPPCQGLHPYASPGSFNDPDMLVVGLDGMYPYGIVQDCPEHVRGCKPGMYISRDRWGRRVGAGSGEQARGIPSHLSTRIPAGLKRAAHLALLLLGGDGVEPVLGSIVV